MNQAMIETLIKQYSEKERGADKKRELFIAVVRGGTLYDEGDDYEASTLRDFTARKIADDIAYELSAAAENIQEDRETNVVTFEDFSTLDESHECVMDDVLERCTYNYMSIAELAISDGASECAQWLVYNGAEGIPDVLAHPEAYYVVAVHWAKDEHQTPSFNGINLQSYIEKSLAGTQC